MDPSSFQRLALARATAERVAPRMWSEDEIHGLKVVCDRDSRKVRPNRSTSYWEWDAHISVMASSTSTWIHERGDALGAVRRPLCLPFKYQVESRWRFSFFCSFFLFFFSFSPRSARIIQSCLKRPTKRSVSHNRAKGLDASDVRLRFFSLHYFSLLLYSSFLLPYLV